jgi:hypothetical protein
MAGKYISLTGADTGLEVFISVDHITAIVNGDFGFGATVCLSSKAGFDVTEKPDVVLSKIRLANLGH